jgi:hypothetical protein
MIGDQGIDFAGALGALVLVLVSLVAIPILSPDFGACAQAANLGRTGRKPYAMRKGPETKVFFPFNFASKTFLTSFFFPPPLLGTQPPILYMQGICLWSGGLGVQ